MEMSLYSLETVHIEAQTDQTQIEDHTRITKITGCYLEEHPASRAAFMSFYFVLCTIRKGSACRVLEEMTDEDK